MSLSLSLSLSQAQAQALSQATGLKMPGFGPEWLQHMSIALSLLCDVARNVTRS
ncbi:UNVERIFIED_ORG: hypothetical protein GGR78_002842 [Xanthomonas campestris]